MNIHHLELFYYARHGGISAAVRHLYGVQQPAVSGQIRQLERNLGETLFVRQPFRLTPAGERLFALIQPIFARLATVEPQFATGVRDRSRSPPPRSCSVTTCRPSSPRSVRACRASRWSCDRAAARRSRAANPRASK